MAMRMLFHVDRMGDGNVARQDGTLFLQGTGVGAVAEVIAHARRQERIDDLGWLFTSEPQDAVIEETSNLVRQDDKMAMVSADVPCVHGRESANLIGLEGVAEGSADVSCVLARESTNLIGLEGAAKVIRDELCARYNDLESVDHLGADPVVVGGAELGSRRIQTESATDSAKSAALFNHQIGITNTARNWTKDGLRKAQERDTEIAPLLK